MRARSTRSTGAAAALARGADHVGGDRQRLAGDGESRPAWCRSCGRQGRRCRDSGGQARQTATPARRSRAVRRGCRARADRDPAATPPAIASRSSAAVTCRCRELSLNETSTMSTRARPAAKAAAIPGFRARIERRFRRYAPCTDPQRSGPVCPNETATGACGAARIVDARLCGDGRVRGRRDRRELLQDGDVGAGALRPARQGMLATLTTFVFCALTGPAIIMDRALKARLREKEPVGWLLGSVVWSPRCGAAARASSCSASSCRCATRSSPERLRRAARLWQLRPSDTRGRPMPAHALDGVAPKLPAATAATGSRRPPGHRQGDARRGRRHLVRRGPARRQRARSPSAPAPISRSM